MRIHAEEINLLDEWIFPEKKDPYVELSLKIIEILKAKVKSHNKANEKKTTLKQLKQAFVAGASFCDLKDSDLIDAGFSRVEDFLLGSSKDFKKENFSIQHDSKSNEFEITYAKNKEDNKNEEEKYDFSDYAVNSIEELYLEDYSRCSIENI